MNVLINDFPEAIDVDGQVIEIDYSYQNCINIMLACEDEGLTKQEKAFVILSLLYLIDLQDINNHEKAVEQAIKFLNCGDELDPEDESLPKKRVYSFEKDSKYIFTAVDSVLDGRVSKNEDIHWWVFCMAFMEIPEECMLSKIINLRTKKNKGKLSKEEKEVYYNNIDIMEIDVDKDKVLNKNQEENLNTFLALLNGEAEVK